MAKYTYLPSAAAFTCLTYLVRFICSADNIASAASGILISNADIN